MAFMERCTSQQLATAVILWKMPVFDQPQLCQIADDCMDLKCLDLILSTTDIFTDAFKSFFRHVIRTHFKEIPKSKTDFLKFLKPRCLLLSRKSSCFYMILVCSFLGEVVSELYLVFKCCHFTKVAYKRLLSILESRFKEILETDAGWEELISFCRRMHQFKFPRETTDDESLRQQEFIAAYKCVINFESGEIEVTDLRVSSDENIRDGKNMATSASLEDKKHLSDGVLVNTGETGEHETSIKSFETGQLDTDTSTNIEIGDRSRSSSSTQFADNLHREENCSSIANEDMSFKTDPLVLRTQSSDSDQSHSSSSTETVDIFNLDETYISIENQDTDFETSHLNIKSESTDIKISDQSPSSSSTEIMDIEDLEEIYTSIQKEDTSFETSYPSSNTESTDIEISHQSRSRSSTEFADILHLEENYSSIANQDASFGTSHLVLRTQSSDNDQSSSTKSADIFNLDETYISIENQDTDFETSHLNLNTESTDIKISDQSPSSSSTEIMDIEDLEESYTSIENEDTSFETSHHYIITESTDIEISDQSHSSSSTEIMGLLELEESYTSIENEDPSFESSHQYLIIESTDIEISDQSHSSSSTEIADIIDLEENYNPGGDEDSSFVVGYMDLNTESTDTETSNESNSSSSTESTDEIHFEENVIPVENDCYFIHEYRTDREEQHRSPEKQFKWGDGSEGKKLYQQITETPYFLSEIVGLLENMKNIEISDQSHSSSSTEIADIIDLEENYNPGGDEDSSFVVGYMDLNTESTDTETSNESNSSSSTESTDEIHFEENVIPVENDCYFIHEYRTDREEQHRSPEKQFKWGDGSEGKKLYQQITETPYFLSEIVGLLENMKSTSEINIDSNDCVIQVSDTEEIENIERSCTLNNKDSISRKIVFSDKAVDSIKEEICKKIYETSKVVRPEEVTDKDALDFFFKEFLKPSDMPECELCRGRGKKYVFNWIDKFMETNVNAFSNVFKKFSQYQLK
ncbi:uncharacterized protein TNCT_54331 [Trichonephila clavata]|uniref:Uncharacterized protein n=1 Tax=Trichonephila clavata TaxID=2740835 RepID=A0A8X6G0I2_TRICU|nr:uncharacterized protein TNCT_54331 [Trichonephila clavata]